MLLESEARQAVIEFCKSSRIWTEEELIEAQPGVGEYRLRPVDGGRIDQVLKIVYADTNGNRRVLSKVDRRMLTGMAEAGEPNVYAERPDVLHIHPVPPNPGSLYLDVVLVPLQDGMSFPDHLYERWREAFVAGASARLLMHSNKPWTNEQKALVLQRKFDLAVRDARQNAASDQWAPQSIQLRRWV